MSLERTSGPIRGRLDTLIAIMLIPVWWIFVFVPLFLFVILLCLVVVVLSPLWLPFAIYLWIDGS